MKPIVVVSAALALAMAVPAGASSLIDVTTAAGVSSKLDANGANSASHVKGLVGRKIAESNARTSSRKAGWDAASGESSPRRSSSGTSSWASGGSASKGGGWARNDAGKRR
ncbi:MAG TPA: hypothetical protein VKA21_09660 [Candidatus Binatia bacterium]|nr:hypothetical protein [Candidatus Binatia bacterium]